ncbi:MAG TPA: STAS domain-containing protein [Oscillatoriaceae cyanobacterium M33_DOE_052]|uniref:Anti-sigma factor antagonist n=1 Tax=Planktothricoides sp. SpSt-374 TaxID=2282167 RepID=A0A7C3VKM4_9CYAN|nr:STAS domain-containing protein [Oscillatoriaceae cyanobacterium M33_DOE_052]
MTSELNYEVVRPNGILDGTQAIQLRQEISQRLDKTAEIILIDLQEVTFIDSSGLGALVSALKMVRTRGGKLFICSINDQVRMLFELTSMDRVFKVFKDEYTFKNEFTAKN